jgi:hypothetical protein
MHAEGAGLLRSAGLACNHPGGELFPCQLPYSSSRLDPPEVLGVCDVVQLKYRLNPHCLKRSVAALVWPTAIRPAYPNARGPRPVRRWTRILGIRCWFRGVPQYFLTQVLPCEFACRPSIQHPRLPAKSCHSRTIPKHFLDLPLTIVDCRRSERLLCRGIELRRRIVGVKANRAVKICEAALVISAANPCGTTALVIARALGAQPNSAPLPSTERRLPACGARPAHARVPPRVAPLARRCGTS